MKVLGRSIWQAMFLANLALTLALLGNFLRLTYGPGPEEGAVETLASKGASAAHGVPSITVPEAAKHLIAGDAVFVDARPVEAYKEGSIPTALSLPVGEKLTSRDMVKLRPASLIIVYCDGPTCNAAEEVASELWARGLTKLAVLTAGWQGWTDGGMPAVKATDPTGK